MNHRGLRWNVHCLANVELRNWLILYKRGFKIYDHLVFLVFVSPDTDLTRPILTQAIFNVYNFKDIVFFIVCEMVFSFGFIEAFDLKGLMNTLKKVLRQPWNALTLQLSLLLCDR